MIKPNVLFLPKWYPNRTAPLNGNFVENHAIAISKFVSIAVLFVRSEQRSKGPVYDLQISESNGFPVVRVYFKKLNGIAKIWTPYRYFKAQRKGYQQLKSTFGTPNLCHVHVLSRSGIFARYLKATQKIPYVITEHWTGFVRGEFKGTHKWLGKKVAEGASSMSTVTQFLAQHIQQSGIKGNVEILPNVVDTELFRPAEKQQERNVIVHISDLKNDHKNISGLIRASHSLHSKRQDFEVHIIGKGPDLEMLKKLTAELKMEQHIHFLGELTGEDLVKEIQLARCISLFSNYETFGVVLIEALSCGKPVVASKLKPIEEFINQEQGILVEKGNQEALATAFDYMLNHYDSYEADALHEYVKSNFSFESVGKKFENWYTNTLMQS